MCRLLLNVAALIFTIQRRLLSPGFSIAYLNGLELLMLECIRTFEETLDSKLERGNVVDIAHMLENLTSVGL
jgi:hypothetical protein